MALPIQLHSTPMVYLMTSGGNCLLMYAFQTLISSRTQMALLLDIVMQRSVAKINYDSISITPSFHFPSL